MSQAPARPMDCDEVEALLLDLAYDELDEADVPSVRAHVGGCEACQRSFARLTTARTLASEMPRPDAPTHILTALVAAAEAHALAERTAAQDLESRVAIPAARREPSRSPWADWLRWLASVASAPQAAMATLLLLTVGIGLWSVPRLRSPDEGGGDETIVDSERPRTAAISGALEPAERLRLGLDPRTHRMVPLEGTPFAPEDGTPAAPLGPASAPASVVPGSGSPPIEAEPPEAFRNSAASRSEGEMASASPAPAARQPNEPAPGEPSTLELAPQLLQAQGAAAVPERDETAEGIPSGPAPSRPGTVARALGGADAIAGRLPAAGTATDRLGDSPSSGTGTARSAVAVAERASPPPPAAAAPPVTSVRRAAPAMASAELRSADSGGASDLAAAPPPRSPAAEPSTSRAAGSTASPALATGGPDALADAAWQRARIATGRGAYADCVRELEPWADRVEDPSRSGQMLLALAECQRRLGQLSSAERSLGRAARRPTARAAAQRELVRIRAASAEPGRADVASTDVGANTAGE